MLAGVYYGSTYGGSTASILLNLPGTPSTAVTCLDGYPMAQKGRAGVALFMTTIASFFGATVGILIMTLFSPLIVAFALSFGPAEYFAMMVLGLVAAVVDRHRLAGQGHRHGGDRRAARPGRLRSRDRTAALHLRRAGAVRRRAAGRRRHGPVRRGGGHLQHPRRQARARRSQEHHPALHGADARRLCAARACRWCAAPASARSSAPCPAPAASSPRSWPTRSRRRSPRTPSASARARSKASWRRNRPTTPPTRPPSSRP